MTDASAPRRPAPFLMFTVSARPAGDGRCVAWIDGLESVRVEAETEDVARRLVPVWLWLVRGWAAEAYPRVS